MVGGLCSLPMMGWVLGMPTLAPPRCLCGTSLKLGIFAREWRKEEENFPGGFF